MKLAIRIRIGLGLGLGGSGRGRGGVVFRILVVLVGFPNSGWKTEVDDKWAAG